VLSHDALLPESEHDAREPRHARPGLDRLMQGLTGLTMAFRSTSVSRDLTIEAIVDEQGRVEDLDVIWVMKQKVRDEPVVFGAPHVGITNARACPEEQIAGRKLVTGSPLGHLAQ